MNTPALNGLTCGTCRYWVRENPTDLTNNRGRCHAHPPQVVVLMQSRGPNTQYMTSSEFPVTQSPMWCAEHEKKEFQ